MVLKLIDLGLAVLTGDAFTTGKHEQIPRHAATA
jgi:hypothetical protein